MKDLQNLFAFATLLLLAVATYMRLAGTVISSKYGTKGSSQLHTGYDSADSVFLCALLVGVFWCLVFWMNRQRS